MQLGMIGLGRMGANMVRRLLRSGHECVVFDVDAASVDALEGEGAKSSRSLDDFVSLVARPRVVWMMVPAGDATERTVDALAGLLEDGDVLVDGGNSYFKDDIRRARRLAPRGVRYVDVGTSGGVWGLDRGYCLMVGGPEDAVLRLDSVFRTLSPGASSVERTVGREGDLLPSEEGYLHCGPVGAGHFVKMVHNGIEYGMMQAYAEGFDILHGASREETPVEQRYAFDVAEIAEVWRRGSVIGSWLLDLTAKALAEDPELSEYAGRVPDSGEGRWTVQTAIEEGVPSDVLAAALFARFRSRRTSAFGDKLLSAMRRQFGGHAEFGPGGSERGAGRDPGAARKGRG